MLKEFDLCCIVETCHHLSSSFILRGCIEQSEVDWVIIIIIVILLHSTVSIITIEREFRTDLTGRKEVIYLPTVSLPVTPILRRYPGVETQSRVKVKVTLRVIRFCHKGI